MKEVIRKEILYDLQKTQEILTVRETQDLEQLQELSNHAIEDVAAHKDLDLIAVTVLIYSLYKVVPSLNDKEYTLLLQELRKATTALQQNAYSQYNRSIKQLYELMRTFHAKVKEHLQDVMHAARVKKGTILLQKGLSIGQAAGLMGLSNWDLQAYAAQTTALELSKESIPAKKRLLIAFKIFGVPYGR